MLGSTRAGVAWFMCGGSLCVVVALHFRAFLGGFCVEWGVVWFGIWVGVCVVLREESVEIGRDGVCLLCVAGIVLVCVFLRVWVVLVALRA